MVAIIVTPVMILSLIACGADKETTIIGGSICGRHRNLFHGDGSLRYERNMMFTLQYAAGSCKIDRRWSIGSVYSKAAEDRGEDIPATVVIKLASFYKTSTDYRLGSFG